MEKEYKASLADNPFDEKSECRLGEIAFRATNLKDALAHYSRAVDLQPNDADAALGLGNTLAAMHQPEKARALLEHAVQLEPFDPAIHYRLASVYRELGRAADANRELAEFKRIRDMKERLKSALSGNAPETGERRADGRGYTEIARYPCPKTGTSRRRLVKAP